MSLIIGIKRAVSHSCLVRSAVEMPKHLEKRVKNLDQVFLEQWGTFNEASHFIRFALDHEIMENWQHIIELLETCEARMEIITDFDYMRASSYEVMRIVNTRMTDVLNVILPVKEFMEVSIRLYGERMVDEAEETRKMNALEQEAAGSSKAQKLTFSENDVVEASNSKANEDRVKRKELIDAIKEAEETDLLLNQRREKRNDNEEPPRRRGSFFFGCFGF
ncbi:GED domain-containing protein [Caenorhabditis elegans]|uniref:GED domain-containing protein n=1 Tax=Caenorhabditis elegans TaxID=6239 RepID=B6VQ81_CAEEL|nr:GED domain-containing protein [Caenorhabditis elegans]CAR97848.1 GED domain-containing protein [Caenorhabditis elegans]|eukprot:NP_001257120.1 Uncharacterized protein CELE_T21E8.7 [Caenorhabditis elegans]